MYYNIYNKQYNTYYYYYYYYYYPTIVPTQPMDMSIIAK